MEKRAILALVLCGLVLIIHVTVIMPMFAPERPEPPEQQPPAQQPAQQKSTAVGTPATTLTPQPAAPKTTATAKTTGTAKPPRDVKPPDTVVRQKVTPPAGERARFRAVPAPAGDAAKTWILASKELTTRWTNRWTGACLDVTLNGFYKTIKRKQPHRPLGAFETVTPAGGAARAPRYMTVASGEIGDVLANMTMTATQDADNVITFRGTIQQYIGEDDDNNPVYSDYLELVKTVRLAEAKEDEKKYEIIVEVEMANLSDGDLDLSCTVHAIEGLAAEKGGRGGPSVRYAFRSESGPPILKEEKIEKLDEEEWGRAEGGILWAGLDDRYFAALVMVEYPTKTSAEDATIRALTVRVDENVAEGTSADVALTSKVLHIPKGDRKKVTWRLFVGPKQSNVLAQYEAYGLPKMVDFGMFGFISHIIIWILRGFHKIVDNWGVAIILLTVVIRVLLHPLTKKSQIAMHKMQKLKPRITELQKKFKNDRQKLGQAQMELFREHGVSPFSGCLPMLLQLPILFALFWALRLTFEMRQSPFIWWIKDLSVPDAVALPFSLPLVGNSLNVLPVLMTVAMFMQQRLMPKSDDPQTQQQQKVMMFLPVVFMFLFYTFPSGLCLYWFTSTVLGMAEQIYIKRHLDALPEPAVAAANGKSSPAPRKPSSSRRSSGGARGKRRK